MSDFIGIDIQGADEVAKRLEKLPYAVGDDGTEAANEYVLNKVRAYAPSHKGEKFEWSSEKQRRYVFATQKLPYNRTQRLRRGWQLLGSGRNQIIVNEVPYAKYVKDEAQIVGHGKREWTKTSDDIKNSMTRILQKFDAGVKKAIKRLGL